ncbi:hypothetical protein BLNAU_104 [Blattamonas nauphoetae]|uniref:Uncharacterized protein n=1 Tax=Blattamonas nauphoetae TaxID=2049346 RepID=A0ABQ9YMP0_9EUKA|nr:hypothetical protein BLNAU_104 [Blattamonas nauphoetae]
MPSNLTSSPPSVSTLFLDSISSSSETKEHNLSSISSHLTSMGTDSSSLLLQHSGHTHTHFEHFIPVPPSQSPDYPFSQSLPLHAANPLSRDSVFTFNSISHPASVDRQQLQYQFQNTSSTTGLPSGAISRTSGVQTSSLPQHPYVHSTPSPLLPTPYKASVSPSIQQQPTLESQNTIPLPLYLDGILPCPERQENSRHSNIHSSSVHIQGDANAILPHPSSHHNSTFVSHPQLETPPSVSHPTQITQITVISTSNPNSQRGKPDSENVGNHHHQQSKNASPSKQNRTHQITFLPPIKQPIPFPPYDTRQQPSVAITQPLKSPIDTPQVIPKNSRSSTRSSHSEHRKPFNETTPFTADPYPKSAPLFDNPVPYSVNRSRMTVTLFEGKPAVQSESVPHSHDGKRRNRRRRQRTAKK